MRISRRLCIFLCAIVLILLLIISLFFLLGYSRQPEKDCPFPESGTWFCKELGITIYRDTGECVFFDGEDMITCAMTRDRGSYDVYIHCSEFNNSDYEFAYIFFSGEFLDINGDVFYVQEHKNETVYTFSKVIE